MQASLSSTRSFLSTRGALKSLHRRKNSADSNSTQTSARPDSQVLSGIDPRQQDGPAKSVKPSQAWAALDRRNEAQRPIHTDPEVNLASLTAAQWNQASYERFTEEQSEKQIVWTQEHEYSEPRTSEETMKEVGVQLKPFKGLDYPVDLGSNKQLIDDDILKSAFGITMSRGGSTEGTVKGIKDEKMVKVQIPKGPGPGEDIFEMEVPLQLVKAQTPELEVNTPVLRSTLDRTPRHESSSPVPQSAVSVLSPNMNNAPPAQVSVVSPVEAVESPKPRRPFSTASIEGMTRSGPEKKPVAPPIPSANSLSSAGTTDLDTKSPGYSQESPRSSMSSVNSETGLPKLQSENHPDVIEASPLRLDTTSMYHAALAPRSRGATSPFQNHHTQQTQYHPTIHRSGSETSLRSNMTSRTNMTSANINKPLPPEPPKRLSTISSVPSDDSSLSRSSTVTVRQPPPGNSAGNHPMPPNRNFDLIRSSTRSSSSGASLRSKYTPQDLDALDDAFLQRNPPTRSKLQNLKSPPPPSPAHISSALHSSPNQNNSNTNERWLGSISEEPSHNRKGSVSSDVMQISRGPMQMRPTRRAPVPPKTPRSNQAPTSSSQPTSPEAPRLAMRSQSSNHIGTQSRENLDMVPAIPKRSTTLVVGSSSKADRILGKTPDQGHDHPRQDIQFDSSIWTRSESPQNISQSSSKMSSRGEINSPELERSPADAYFYEIQKRLELLSPKDDPSATFQAFQQRPVPAMRSSEALRPEDVNLLTKELEAKAYKALEETEESVDQEQRASAMEPERRQQSFIAELEAPYVVQPSTARKRSLEPIELPGSDFQPIAELGLPSPKPPMTQFSNLPAPPPEPAATEDAPGIVTGKRGRVDKANPQSSLSAKSRSLHSQGSFRVRSLASLAASEIPDIYAHLPAGSKTNSLHPSMASMSPEEVEMLVSAETAEKVLLYILQSLDNLGDLFAAARVSRGFYKTFKRHELHLLKLALGKMSMAAWELREMSIPYDELEEGASDYTPRLYFRHYVQDLMTMVELKALILDNCKSFLRPDTIQALAGETNRSEAIDEAFWRVWTFCRIFGCGNNREDDIVGQMDWLRGGTLAKQSSGHNTLALADELAKNSVLFNPPKGFAKGNGPTGLSSEELYDMFELWTCLGVLLQGFQHEKEKAREVGIFDNSDIPKGDSKKESRLIEEWTFHLLANAPSTILDVVSATEPTAARFSRAQSKGHTYWTPAPEGASKSTFLKEAVTKVYGEKLELEKQPASSSPRSFSDLPQVVTPPSASSPDPANSRQRIQAYGDEIRAKKQDPSYSTLPVSPDRPMSDFNNVVNRLETLDPASGRGSESASVPRTSSIASRFSRRKPKNKTPLESTAESPAESQAESSNSSPVASRTNVSGNIGERIASLRHRVTRHDSPSSHAAGRRRLGLNISSPLQGSLERLPPPQETAEYVSSEPRTAMETFLDTLVDMGFDEGQARKALTDCRNGDRFDLDKAIKTLSKQKKRADRLERLNKMG